MLGVYLWCFWYLNWLVCGCFCWTCGLLVACGWSLRLFILFGVFLMWWVCLFCFWFWVYFDGLLLCRWLLVMYFVEVDWFVVFVNSVACSLYSVIVGFYDLLTLLRFVFVFVCVDLCLVVCVLFGYCLFIVEFEFCVCLGWCLW